MARCCVKGCNNSTPNKKRCSHSLSFYSFPLNQECKMKWLKAIGRPNWDPPSDSQICSAHFELEQISRRDGSCGRLEADAVPIKALPPQCDFEASDVEACRICLAVNIKMYNIQTTVLSSYMEIFNGLLDQSITDVLPQFVCYLCTADIIRCCRLVEKSMISHKMLLDIYEKNGEINENLIRRHEKSILNNDYLTICDTSDYVHLEYDDDNAISITKQDFLGHNKKYNTRGNVDKYYIYKQLDKTDKVNNGDGKDIEKDTKRYFNDVSKISSRGRRISTCNDDESTDENITTRQLRDRISPSSEHSDVDKKSAIFLEVDDEVPIDYIEEEMVEKMLKEDSLDSANEASNYDCDSDGNYEMEASGNDIEFEELVKKFKERSKVLQKSVIIFKPDKVKRRRIEGFTQQEIAMQKYFNIVKLSPTEQIEEWQTFVSQRDLKSDTVYECGTCGRRFSQMKPLDFHVTGHDPDLGDAECPVCKMRFRTEQRMTSHIDKKHAKKFYCRACPRAYYNVGEAKRHQLWHAGHRYRCALCPFDSVHSSAFGAHMLQRHRHAHSCGNCGRAFVSEASLKYHQTIAHYEIQEERDDNENTGETHRCELCGINFASADAMKVHMLSSAQHSKTPGDRTESPLLARCRQCAQHFVSRSELQAHVKAEHPVPRDQPDVTYPTKCHLCEEIMRSRREHWLHVRGRHPKEVNTYQAVVKAVCDICGRGCQTRNGLRLHKLRHSNPRVTCLHCPRRFFDKYALARHIAYSHTCERPHICSVCGMTFKVRGNLRRHAKVHSDVAQYTCTTCNKKFKYTTSLNLHVRTVHFKQPPPPRRKQSRPPAEAVADSK